MIRRLGGWNVSDPNQEIGFGSCRACGRGEAARGRLPAGARGQGRGCPACRRSVSGRFGSLFFPRSWIFPGDVSRFRAFPAFLLCFFTVVPMWEGTIVPMVVPTVVAILAASQGSPRSLA